MIKQRYLIRLVVILITALSFIPAKAYEEANYEDDYGTEVESTALEDIGINSVTIVDAVYHDVTVVERSVISRDHEGKILNDGSFIVHVGPIASTADVLEAVKEQVWDLHSGGPSPYSDGWVTFPACLVTDHYGFETEMKCNSPAANVITTLLGGSSEKLYFLELTTPGTSEKYRIGPMTLDQAESDKADLESGNF